MYRFNKGDKYKTKAEDVYGRQNNTPIYLVSLKQR